MTEIVIERTGYDIEAARKKAQTRPEYYQETILLEVARRISDAMKENGMTRAELARKLAVTPAYITKVLRGNENFSLQTLARIAFTLNRKWECLLIGQGFHIGPYCLLQDGISTTKTVETTTLENPASNQEDLSEYGRKQHYEYAIPA